jgi:hypothetical protein
MVSLEPHEIEEFQDTTLADAVDHTRAVLGINAPMVAEFSEKTPLYPPASWSFIEHTPNKCPNRNGKLDSR